MVCLRHDFKSIREADTTTIHYSLFTIHYSFPSCGERYKKYPPPERSGVGYKSIPRFHPGCFQQKPLIGALTGAPVRAFLPCGSEVVSSPAGVRMPCTKTATSLGIFPEKHVFITAFYGKILAQFFCLVNHSGKKCSVEGCFCLSKSVSVHK